MRLGPIEEDNVVQSWLSPNVGGHAKATAAPTFGDYSQHVAYAYLFCLFYFSVFYSLGKTEKETEKTVTRNLL